MNKKELNFFLMKNTIDEVEKNLFYFYLKNNKINYNKSELLNEYFENSNFKIISELKSINFSNLREFESILELLIPLNDKSINGAFFTMPYIVDFIINEISPTENSQNLDPACGSSAFLIGLTEYFIKKYNKNIKQVLIENIFGIDILDYNTRRTKLILSLLALTHNEIINETDLNILNTDSLKTFTNFNGFKFNNGFLNSFDNIVGNPPYVKFQDLSNENRVFLSNNWETTKNGTYNLYFAFFELGYKLIKENGKLGFITPNNYFTSLSGEPLRKYFHFNKAVYKIIDFNHKKIFDAQTYTSLTFLSKACNDTIEFDRIKSDQNCEEFLKGTNYSINQLNSLNPKKWRLLKNDEQYNIKTIENIGKSIHNLYNINVGISTLKDDLYFIDETFEKSNYYLKIYKGKQFEIEKNITKSIYKISDFKNAEEFVNNHRRIIFPYKVENNIAIPYNSEEMNNKFPKCFEYFNAIKSDLNKRDKGKNIEPFYAYGRTQGLTKYGVKIVTPTFSKKPRFSFIENKDSFFCNGYGLFYPENKNTSLFEDSDMLVDVNNVDAVLKILNSYVMHYYISKTSVAIEGNYPCYQKNFIEKFSIPDFTFEEISYLKNEKDFNNINKFLISKYNLKLDYQNLVW